MGLRRLAVLLVVPFVFVASASAQVTPEQASALGREAYLYGFPLLETLRVEATDTSVRCPDGETHAPVNVLGNARGFARVQDRTVVAPNVDTLYSIAHLDLGDGPVVLSHPAMGSRYFTFQFLDAYTNTFGYVGTRTTGARTGRFALAWSGRSNKRVRGARRTIVSPTRRVWVIGRTLATDDPVDIRAARRLMARYRLTPPGGAPRFPSRCTPGRVVEAPVLTGRAFLDALNRALAENPPPARDTPLLSRLAAVQVGPGLDVGTLPPAVLDALVTSVNATAAALPTIAKNTVKDQAARNRGWSIPARQIGDYGTDYTYRAAVASVGLGANTRDEAIYPTAYGDESGTPLDGRLAYRMTFRRGALPPTKAFWSLTMYDDAGFLVPNPIDRYAIGDSHPPLVTRPDGSVVVALQRTKPAERDVNWLPTPPAPFRLNLRLYWPAAAALNETWQPPPVVKLG